jgi:hypothetical protein
MSKTSDDDFPSAKECMKTIAVAEAEKASEYMRRESAAEADKRALMERFEKPSGVSDEERLKRAKAIIRRAVNNGLTEVQVIRFPNTLPARHALATKPTSQRSDGRRPAKAHGVHLIGTR